MSIFATFIILLSPISIAFGQILGYEGDSVFPENSLPAWQRVGTNDATRSLIDGVLVIDVDLGNWAPPPGGEQDFYRLDIPQFQGSPFFVQWRCRSTAPISEIDGTGGIVINSVGGASAYHFTITSAQVDFWRDNFLPILSFPISAADYHSYRVECDSNTSYNVYIDGMLVDSGLPEGVFPNASARIIWGAKMWNTPSVNEFDYVRYGTIPQPQSGDYDSDDDVDHDDLYFFLDCLLGPDYDAAGPGCKWADMNSDGVANGADIAQFTAAMLAE